MNAKELYGYFNELIPSSLSCSWDNDGLMVCPEYSKKIKKVMLALDITSKVVDEAIAEGCDAIISHHPFIFQPLSQIIPEGKGALIMRLIKANISAMSFHTRFDALQGGVNDILCGKLGMVPSAKFGEDGEEIGRICIIHETEPSEIARRAKQALSAPFVLLASKDNRKVKKIAVCGGDAKSMIGPARKAGCDMLICGRAGFNAELDAADLGFSVLEVGHYYSEAPSLSFFRRELEANGIKVVIANSNNINAI